MTYFSDPLRQSDISSPTYLLLLCCISPGHPGGSLLLEEHMLGSFLLSVSEFVFYLDYDFSIFF